MNYSDQQLLSLLKSGDQKAVQHWFSHFQPRLLRYVLTKVASHEDAEELVQETFINCLKHMPLFRGDSAIFTWMCSIANHEVADFYRKRYAKKAIKTVGLLDFLDLGKVENAHEVSEEVKKTLAKMKKDYGELLMKKYVDKSSVKEMARDLGRTVKSVESDLFRARKEFRLLWDDTDN